MFNKLRQFNNKGFTILEIIFAIFIVLIGILASYTVVQQIMGYTSIASSRLVAAYLSQEGIEIIRNIRDTNWIQTGAGFSELWDGGLPGGNYQADYRTTTFAGTGQDPCSGIYNCLAYGSGDYLKIDSNGFYNYSSGTTTKYKRKITSDGSVNDILKVSVEVNWTEKGNPYTVTAQENLYNWYPQ